MLLQGREDGCEGSVKTLLKKLEAPAYGAVAVADPAGIDPLGFQSPLAQAPASTAVFTFSGGADKADKPRKSAVPKTRSVGDASLRRARPAVWRWVLSILVLGGISVGVTAWLHPTVFKIDRAELAQRWAKLSAKAEAPAVTAVAPAAAVPTEAAPPVVPAALEPAPVEPPAGIIEPAAEALADQTWVNAMPTGSYVVQYAAMPTFQAAEVWKKGVPALAQARIVAVYRPREKLAYFVVIDGPFTSRTLATESGSAPGKPGGAWVRTARSVRNQFNSELAAAGPPQESMR
jgi:hypothetical protein